MLPRVQLGVAAVPGGEPLRLVRHGDDFIIMLERNELMSSRMSGSEEALGMMTLERIAGRPAPRILIGGYGMGFTLRAVLAGAGPKAEVVVAELVPGVIGWARDQMAEMTGGCLDDPRVAVRIGDVAVAIEDGPWDAILLDVDNGPDGVTRPANDRLYSPAGLSRAKAGLAPGGVLAVWSAGADAAFTGRLKKAGYAVDEVRLRARRNGKGPMHTIWFAAKAARR